MNSKSVIAQMHNSRITIFAGHYGSGKTQLAVNWALNLRERGLPVVLCDLDIVNPYFRTTDYAGVLLDAGVELIASAYANSNLESPAIPPEVNKIFDSPDVYAVLDVGGDERGMLALGRYADRIRAAGYQMWLVANLFRPLSSTPALTLELLLEMEAAAGLMFTGIINNANLGDETTVADIVKGDVYADKLAKAANLPVVMTSVRRELAGMYKNDRLMPIDIFSNKYI